jgi:poly(glycerol-phosphate) alpha-glucosyltransferase
MLDPWALRNSGWKKKLALLAYEREHLQKASCLHALCHAEADAMRTIGLRNPICIVPNSVDLPILERSCTPAWRKQIPPGAKILLYLGRLHAKKGLVNLLRAWECFAYEERSDWHLLIVGWDQGGHEGELRQLVRQRGLDGVHFPGPLFGADKHAAYAAADAFILPSVSEGLPLVVLEAWSHGVPVVMTPACNLPEGFATGAALEIGPDIEGIREGLDQIIHMSTEHRRAMGELGRRLCRDRFSSMRVGEMMREVYRWLLDSGPRPESVLVDTDSQATARRHCLSVHSTGMARPATD